MTAFSLCGALAITPDGPIEDAVVTIAEGRITGISRGGGAPGAVELGGGYIVPGFIDIQVNGGGGVLFNDNPSVATLRTIAEAHRRFGTTAMLPTLISDTPDKITAAIDAVDQAIASGVPGIIGIHIEGPYLNIAKRGVHDPDAIAPLDDAALAVLTRPGRGKRLVTLAPELAPSGTIERLRRAGIIVCAGHSMATYEQTRDALSEGLDGFTHLFNAMTPLEGRAPGMVGAALEDRRSRFGLIADGYHVHPAAMRVAVAARGVDGVMLVTDAMPLVGTGDTTFSLGHAKVELRDGTLRDPDGRLAGSNLDMASAFANCLSMLGLGLTETARCTSGNAADFLGMRGERGSIVVGSRADLVHLDDSFRPRKVWIGGVLSDG